MHIGGGGTCTWARFQDEQTSSRMRESSSENIINLDEIAHCIILTL